METPVSRSRTETLQAPEETMSDGLAMIAARHEGTLPWHLGMRWARAERGLVEGGFTIEQRHLAGNGFLHAATVIALVGIIIAVYKLFTLADLLTAAVIVAAAIALFYIWFIFFKDPRPSGGGHGGHSGGHH